jgi:transcriptional regulator with XRE-family HTH domain
MGKDKGLGDRVETARKRRGWSREELAVHASLSWSAIAQVESGRRRQLRPATLVALARALGVTAEYLVHGGSASSMLEHRALIYGGDREFVDTLGPFMAEGVACEHAVLAVTTPRNAGLLRDHLGDDAGGVEFVEADRWYGSPASAIVAFADFVNTNLEAGASWIRIVGEPLWEGRSEAEIGGWIRYESLFNLAFAASPVTTICPYDERAVSEPIVAQARHTHPETVGPSGVERSADYADPAAFVLEP